MQTIDPGVLSVQPEHAYGGEPRDPLDMVPFDLATPDTAPDEMQGAAARRISAAVGVPDPDGRIWQGRPFASGAAYLDYMRGLLKSGDIWEYVASDELKAFEAADDAGRVKIAREAMGFVDRAAEAAGRRVPEGYGFADGAPELRGAGEDVLAANARLRGDAEAAARHNARAASFAGDFRPLPEREGASADRETMKAWRRQRGDAELVGEYREKLMRENLAVAWLSVEPALSPRAKEIAAGVFRDGKLRPSDIAGFQRLPEDDQRAVARLARLSRNPAAGTFWNTLGDAGIGFFNGVVQLPVNAYKQIGTLTTSIDQSVFGKDAGLVDSAEMNRRARTEQLLREALDDPAGVNPMTTEHGYLARSLIGAVSTLPYMAYASAGAPGFAAVMADFMQRLDDEVAAGGGDVYGRGAEWQARKLLYGAVYAGIERVSALPVWRDAGDIAAKTMFIRLASRLDDEAVAQVAAHIGKQTLAETLEEASQAVVESHAKSVGLDRGDGWAEAFGAGVKEFGETFGTMALVSGFGAARQGFRAASPRGRADLAEYTPASLRRAGFILSDNPYAGRGTKQAVEDSWGAAAHVMDGYRQTWADGGLDALKKRTDISEEQAAVLDHVFAAEREEREVDALITGRDMVARTEGGKEGEPPPALDWEGVRQIVAESGADAESRLAELGFTEAGAARVAGYLRQEAALTQRMVRVLGDIRDRLARDTDAGADPHRAEQQRRAVRAMKDLQPLRTVYQRAGTRGAAAKAFRAMKFTDKQANDLADAFDEERRLAVSPMAASAWKAAYLSGDRSLSPAERLKRMTGFEAAPAPEHGPGAQILTLRGSDGQKRGEILFRPDSAVAFDPESAHAAEAVEQFTGGLVAAAEWRALTPEERAQKTREHGFVAAGGFTVTDPADPSVEATGAQADILTGRIDLAPDAPSAELYHEAAHAWLAAFRRAGKLTDADVARLREAYGPSPTDPAWFNEEKFADDIKEIGAETDYGSDHGGRFPLARRFVSAVRRFAGAARAGEARRAAASGARQAIFENIVYGRAFEGVGDFAAVPAASVDGKAGKDSPLAGASTAPGAAETPETRNPKPETPETRNQKPETPETRNQKPETPAWAAADTEVNAPAEDAEYMRAVKIDGRSPDIRYSLQARRLEPYALPDSLAEVSAGTSVAALAQSKFRAEHARHRELRAAGDWAAARSYARGLAADGGTRLLGNYLLAKYHGDAAAAKAVVERWAKPEEAEKIRERIGDTGLLKPIVFAPAMQREGDRFNALPAVYAQWLAQKINGVVSPGFRKVEGSGAPNTGAAVADRVNRDYAFEGGEGIDGASPVILVDDVWTSGQTLWTVYEHLKAVNPSAHVAAFATLASGRYGKNVRPTAKQLTAFWEKSNLTSKSFKERLGNGIEKLTGSEIQAYILTGGRGPDAAAAFFGGGTRAARGADAGDSRAVRLRSGSGEAGLVDAPVRYALDLTGGSYSKENLIVGYMAHADLTGGPFPSRARVAALADAIGLERHRYNDLAERARALSASTVDDAIRRAAASAAPDAAAFAIGELARAAERALVRAGAAGGARLARSGERIRSLAESGVAAAMRAVTGADYADLQTDTGIDLAASLLAADPKSFGPEEARKRDEAAGAILPDPFTGEDSERVETDEDAPELTDAQRAEIARKRRERESRVQAMLDAAAARASTNRARDEERRRRREAAALADAEDAAGGGEAGADAASGGDAPADPVADALAADTAAPIDLSDRWLAAAILRVWAFARFRRENPLRHDTRGDLTKNRVAVEFYRQTAVRQLTDLARKLLEPGAPRESIRAHIADIAPHLTANQIERRTAFIFGLINRHAIRESQRGLVRKFRAQIKRQFVKGKEFEELGVDIDRTLTGAVEEDARYVMRVCELSDKALDGEPSALEKERARIEAIIAEREGMTDEHGNPLAVGGDDMQLRRALRQLALLDKYGAMVDMMPGEILDLTGEALASLGREALDLAARWEEYDRLVKRIKDPIVRSVSRKPTDPKAADSTLNKAADSTLSMLRQRLDWLTRYEGDPSKREEARAAISDLMNLLAEGHTGYVTARADDRAALMKALGEIFKKPDGRPDRRAIRAYLRRLDEKIPRALAGQLTRQGNQASMTYGQMLHLLAYLDQWASYSDNIIRHDRRGQAALIRSFTYEDPKTGEVRRALTSEDTQLLEWLRRAHYAGKRDVISNVMVRLCGREVESPDPLYHPVRMLQERRASLAAAARVSSWQPLAGVFSRRRKHRLDVDESASILDMFENRSHETAVLTAFGETGLVIREVLTSRAFQDAVRRFHGEKTLSRILRQVAQSLDGGRAQGGGQSAAASLAQRVSTYMYLGFNLHSASKQTASLPVFAARMGFRKLGSILFSPIDRDAVRTLREADHHRARYGTGPASGMSAADREAYSGYDTSPLKRFFGDWGLAPTRWADEFVSLWVGQGVYRDYLAKYLDMGMSREDAERRAVSETYSLIEETQQSGRAENLPEMSREHGFLGRLMVQFATSPLQQMQYEVKEFAEWRDLAANNGPEAGIREARNKFMRAAFINHILVPGMMAAISNAFKLATGDEPDWERDGFLGELMIAAIMGQFGRIFFAGALTEQTLRVLFLRKPPYMGQLVPAEGVIRFAGNLAYPVRDIITWDTEHFRGDIMRLLKSIALTRVPVRIYERATEGE